MSLPDADTMPDEVRDALNVALGMEPDLARLAIFSHSLKVMTEWDMDESHLLAAVYTGMRLMLEYPEWGSAMAAVITKRSYPPEKADYEAGMLRDFRSLVEILPFTHSD